MTCTCVRLCPDIDGGVIISWHPCGGPGVVVLWGHIVVSKGSGGKQSTRDLRLDFLVE